MKKILLLLLIASLHAFSQEREATILFLDSTSIAGFGEIKNQKIHFRTDLKSEKSEWDYDVTKGIIFTGYGFLEKYIFIKPDKYSKPILMEVIEEGKVNLYKKSDFGIKLGAIAGVNSSTGIYARPTASYEFTNDYYVKKENEESATELTFSFKARANRYFSDCPAILEKIKKKEFKVDTIPEMIYYYNDYCGDEEE